MSYVYHVQGLSCLVFVCLGSVIVPFCFLYHAQSQKCIVIESPLIYDIIHRQSLSSITFSNTNYKRHLHFYYAVLVYNHSTISIKGNHRKKVQNHCINYSPTEFDFGNIFLKRANYIFLTNYHPTSIECENNLDCKSVD